MTRQAKEFSSEEVDAFKAAPDRPIYDAIMRCVAGYTGEENTYHPRYHLYPAPQRYSVLADLLSTHVLREAGDYKEYLRLCRQINELPGRQPGKLDLGLLEMCEWLDREIASLAPPDAPSAEEKIVISMLVWGESFVDKMLDVTFRTFLAPGNLPALTREKTVILYFQTDAAGKARIEAAPASQALRELGVKFDYVIVPDNLLQGVDQKILYWIVGMGATIGLAYARSINAGFHHSYPDIVYNGEFFSEMLRLSRQYPVILGPGHSMEESLFHAAAKEYHAGDGLDIPCPDLMAITLNCLHMSCFAYVVNRRPAPFTFPRIHSLIWESRDTAFLNCPHMMAFWISPETLRRLPEDRYYMSLDSEMDLICEGDNFYVPQAQDKMLMEQITDQNRYPAQDSWVSGVEYGHFLWNQIAHRDLFKIFVRSHQVQVNRDIRPAPPQAMTEYQIGAEKAYLFNSCLAVDPHPGKRFKRGRGHVGAIFRSA